MLGKERGEEARVPSWESSELHTSDVHTHIWVVPKELLKAKGVELGPRWGTVWSSGPHLPLRGELHMGVKSTLY